MSDGGAEIGSNHEQQPNAKRKLGGDEFAQAIAKIALAQICERVGFQTFQQSALGMLADVAVQYIYHIGKTANFYANLAGRTEGNIFDILQGLEDLGLAQGFSGASDIDHCLASSGVVQEIVKYVSEAQDSPFAYSIPRFPVVKERNPTPSFLQIGEEPPEEHIPAWLPAFPDPQTYLQLPTQDERAADSHMEKIELAMQQRKVEQRSLLNLQQRFACNGAEGPSSIDHGDISKKNQAAERNPFLSVPLHFEEKEVSSVVCPVKLSNEVAVKHPAAESRAMGNHISVLETFAPAIEAVKNRLYDSEEDLNRVLVKRRPAVQFKIGVEKNPLGKPLQLVPKNKDWDKIAPWFGKDHEKDEKKRRAETILKHSMEKTQELAEM